MSRHVKAGEALGPALAEGGEILLGPGEHRISALITVSATLRGEDGAVLDGGRERVLQVDADGIELRLENLVLRNGAGEVGAGLLLSGWSVVTAVGCRFERGVATEGGGGGAWVARGRLILRHCRFSDNRGRFGGDLVVTGAGEAIVEDCELGGDVAVLEGADLKMSRSRVDGRIDLRGTLTRTPTVSLRECDAAGGVHNDPTHPATLSP